MRTHGSLPRSPVYADRLDGGGVNITHDPPHKFLFKEATLLFP
jgi:hypothetical protein